MNCDELKNAYPSAEIHVFLAIPSGDKNACGSLQKTNSSFFYHEDHSVKPLL